MKLRSGIYMTRRQVLVVIALVSLSAFGNICAFVGSLNKVNAQGDPCGSSFKSATYFSDLDVTRTVDYHKFTVQELIEIIDKQPNVKTTMLRIDPPRPFSIDTLAYPQYASRYELSPPEWADLQAYCREKLRNPIAIDEVVNHWKMIAAGTPPFGLRVRREVSK